MPDRTQTPSERASQGAAVLALPVRAGEEIEQAPEIRPLDWESLSERGTPPPRDWALDYWIGMGHVTLLAGRGGIGKSIVAQQAGTAMALGRDFVSTVKQPRVTLGWMGEDDERELWARELAITAKFGVGLDALRGRLTLYAMDKHECCLLDLVEGRPWRMPMLGTLREQVGDLRAEVVILDNIGRVFGCSENDRHHVSSFFAALNWAASPTNAAVVLIGHVAKIVGSEYAGSTAWENAARARMWFSDKPPDAKPDSGGDDSDDIDSDFRFLSKRKANYSAKDICKLRYCDAAYDVVAAPASGGIIASIDRARASKVVMSGLEKLLRLNFAASDAPTSPYYLPRLIIEHKFSEGLPKRELADAMHRLVADGEIVRDTVKTGNRSTTRADLRPAKQ